MRYKSGLILNNLNQKQKNIIWKKLPFFKTSMSSAAQNVLEVEIKDVFFLNIIDILIQLFSISWTLSYYKIFLFTPFLNLNMHV